MDVQSRQSVNSGMHDRDKTAGGQEAGASQLLEKLGQAIMKVADSSGDQKLTMPELSKVLGDDMAQRLFKADQNGDGFLDQTELATGLKDFKQTKQAEGTHGAGTEGKDGAQQDQGAGGGAENQKAGGGEGKKADGGQEGEDKKGNSADLLSMLTKLLDKPGEDGKKDGKIGDKEMQDFITKYDKDGDKKLSKGELLDGIQAEAKAQGLTELGGMKVDSMLKSFDAMDSDHDGSLNINEFKVAVGQGADAQQDTE